MQPIEVMKIAKSHGLDVEFVSYGIASRMDNTILMNINMPKYDGYCLKVLDHEIRHTPEVSKHNFVMDLFEGSIYENLKFCLKHPKAFSQFIPFGKYKGKWFIDVNQLFVYIIALGLIGVWAILMI